MNKSKHFLLLAAMLFSSHVAWGATGYYPSRNSYENGIRYTYDDRGTSATIYAYDGTADLKIPSTINVNGKTYYVNEINATAFNTNQTKVNSIDLSNTTITSLPADAFDDLTNLTSVILPSTLQTIGNTAFDGCTKLQTINIPNAVTSIGNSSFRNCSALQSIEIPASVTSIGTYAFQNCSTISEVSIPASVTTISANLFNGCTGLSSVTLPESITSIGNSSFSGCSSLSSVEIPNKVTAIGDNAFDGCSKLENINLPASIKTVGTSPFTNCTGKITISCNVNPNLTGSTFREIEFKEGVNTTYTNEFDDLKNVAITLPSSIKSVSGTTPFSNCTGSLTVHCNLTAANLNGSTFSAINFIVDEGVTEIPANTYANIKSYNLASITLPSTLETIGSKAFDGYQGELIVNCNVKDNWFQGIGISSLTVGEGVESIGDYAFSGCSNLTSIVLPSSITQLGDQSFSSEANLTSVDLSKCTKLEILPLYLFAYNPNLSSVSLPNSIKEIQRDVFLDCISLASIVLPENLKTIGIGAFNNTSLSSVSLPASVQTVMDDAFINCKKLKTVTFNGPVETIAIGAFIDCTSLTTVEGFENTKVTEVANALFRGCTSLNDITLPSTITRIGDHAFQGSQLTSIDIPASVTSIESTEHPAFEDCSKLTDVTLHSLPTGLDLLPKGATITMSLTDASNVAAGSSIGNANVTYTRAAGSSTWGTICLPFATQSTDDVTLYQLTKVDMENGILTVEAIEGTVPANTPCLYKKVGDVSNLVFEGNGSVTPVANPALAPIDGWTPKGTYQQVITNQIYYISRNEFHYATETATITINPFRAWFAIDNTQAAASRRDFKIAEWEASTGVSRMLSPEENEEIVYNLFGQQLGKARVNEINIVNGKKCLVK